MKALLLYADRDCDPQSARPPNRTELTEDLGLELLFRSMAQGDEFVLETVRTVVLCSLVNPNEIL